MKRHCIVLLLCLMSALGAPRLSQSQPDPRTAQGSARVIVRLSQSDPQAFSSARADLVDALAGASVEAGSLNWAIPYAALTVDAAALDALRASPLVAEVYPDGINYPELASSIPVIHADDAWARGYTGVGTAVAVLDTGVDASHPFFGGRVVEEACFSFDQGFESLCPNGLSQMVGAGAASPAGCAALSGCTHGTHVAGIAVGSSAGFSGVARGADLIAIQVFTNAGALLAFDSDIISGLNHVYSLRNSYTIAAANLSLSDGFERTDYCDDEKAPLKAAIDLLRSAGIATVVASGNQGYTDSIPSPACVSTAISVGATNDSDTIASFSNRSILLDLFAPGVSITSSVIGGGYGILSGTSMAAPHVAGAMALLKQARPTVSVEAMLTALQLTGEPVFVTSRFIPRIDANAAIDALMSPPVVNLLQNGDFNAGLNGWIPWDAITWQLNNGLFEFYRNPSGVSAAIIQNTGTAVAAGTPLTVQVDLGNSSPQRKRAVVIIHDGDWSDLTACNFWIPPGQALQTYTMSATTGEDWTAAHLSVYASPDDGLGWLRLDNAWLYPSSDAFNGVTICTDPNAP